MAIGELDHSNRNARSGSMRAARRAGIAAATDAISSNAAAALTIALRSYPETPKSRLCVHRAATMLAIAPIDRPMPTGRTASMSTCVATSTGRAPIAMRIPRSRGQ
jgi:hypothetical protein